MTSSQKRDPPAVVHNPAQSRFEIMSGQSMSMLTYRQSGKQMVLAHTEVPEALRGQGLATRLAEAALDYASARQLKVVPRCPFVAEFVGHHPKYEKLLANDPAI